MGLYSFPIKEHPDPPSPFVAHSPSSSSCEWVIDYYYYHSLAQLLRPRATGQCNDWRECNSAWAWNCSPNNCFNCIFQYMERCLIGSPSYRGWGGINSWWESCEWEMDTAQNGNNKFPWSARERIKAFGFNLFVVYIIPCHKSQELSECSFSIANRRQLPFIVVGRQHSTLRGDNDQSATLTSLSSSQWTGSKRRDIREQDILCAPTFRRVFHHSSVFSSATPELFAKYHWMK